MSEYDQPVGRVEWVHRDSLSANDYNPNHVAPPELELLKVSIMADGWTQPIVADPNNVIVDGFHRWTVSEDPDVYAMTDGYVPVVRLHPRDGSRILSTIRHNRARGKHAVLSMSTLVRSLVEDHGVEKDELEKLLGMDAEEVERLHTASSVAERVAKKQGGFGKGWGPQ